MALGAFLAGVLLAESEYRRELKINIEPFKGLLLGHTPHAARQTAMRFRQHNLALFEQLHPHYKDSAKLMSVVKQGCQQLE